MDVGQERNYKLTKLAFFFFLSNDKPGNPQLQLHSGKTSIEQQGNQKEEVIVQRVQLETAHVLTHPDGSARGDKAKLKRQHLDCKLLAPCPSGVAHLTLLHAFTCPFCISGSNVKLGPAPVEPARAAAAPQV